jgi:hypothetical protein
MTHFVFIFRSYTHDDIIQAVPPHWREGVNDEERGERWAGASITVDSRAAAGAPPRKQKEQQVTEEL